MERFFSLVWRINALIILAAGVGALGLVSIIFLEFVSDFYEPRRMQGVVQVADEELEANSFRFGPFEPIAGSSFLVAPLYTDGNDTYSSSGKYRGVSRNYLFFNPNDHSAHWLLPNNDGLVEWRRELRDETSEEDPGPVVAVLWEVITKDSTGDRNISDNDLASIYISEPAGRSLVQLVSEVQKVLGTNRVASDTVVVMFLKGNALRAAHVSIPDLSLLSDQEVSAVPRGPK